MERVVEAIYGAFLYNAKPLHKTKNGLVVTATPG